MYSNMCFNKESGDVNGIELRIVFTKAGHYVVYQASEGMPSVPVVVVARIKDQLIEFDIPEGEPFAGTFRGTIKTQGIEGAVKGYSGYAAHLILKRQHGYWERSGEDKYCK